LSPVNSIRDGGFCCCHTMIFNAEITEFTEESRGFYASSGCISESLEG
jgi:hypothetical protein